MTRPSVSARCALAAAAIAGCSPARSTAPAVDAPDASPRAHAASSTTLSSPPPDTPPLSTAHLRALASARPMTEETAAVFRRANAEGYFSLDAILLADNGSPRALSLLGQMLADRSVPAARRVDGMHFAVYPHRAEPPMLDLAGTLLAGDLDDEVRIGLVEAIFDDQPSRWLDPGARVATPPPWDRAPPDVARRALDLAAKVRARGRLPEPLLGALGRAEGALRRALGGADPRGK
jgi:hypothetical protein